MRPARYRYRTGFAVLACLAAGPIFVLLVAVGAFVHSATHHPIAWDPAALVALPLAAMLLVPVVTVGSILALVPVTVGTLALSHLADLSDVAAEPPLWLLTGAAMAGGAAAWLADGEPLVIAALALTGGLCATICHLGLEPAEEPHCDHRPAARIREASAA